MVGSTSLLGTERARACGPEFPHSLLDDRQKTLQTLPDAPFELDMGHLLDDLPTGTVIDRFVVVDGEPDGVRDRGGPQERALYQQGADAFHRDDHPAAIRSFTALLALPANERRHRSTWAMFMLGRMGDVKAFARVRALVDDGFFDDLGLAVASLGEEARVLRDAGRDADAVTLYARQARLGADHSSLLIVARDLIDDDGPRRRRALRSPVVQRLLASFAMNRGDEKPAKIGVVLNELAAIKGVAFPDRVAAAAWRLGRFDVASRLVRAEPDTPLSLWVQAKLALRAGHAQDAALLLARASRAFPAHAGGRIDVDEDWAGPLPGQREQVLGDEAVLALLRQDYAFALERLLTAGVYWQDAAHVAERVLTVDELMAFVTAHPALSSPENPHVDDDTYQAPRTLRHLLARRLVRAGRLQEARPLFDAFNDEAIVGAIDALIRLEIGHDGHGAGDQPGSIDVDAAQRLQQAALGVRRHGLQLMATELGPDYAIWDGEYQTPFEDSLPLPDDEQRRVTQSAPRPDTRFHYRQVSASMLQDAASHVPPRSQAYAALLCEAAWAARGDRDEVRRLWQRYVDHGAVVDFTGAFGASDNACPAADFDGARTFEARQLERHTPRRRAPSRWMITLALLGIVGIVAGVVAIVRPRSPPPTTT